MSRFRTVLLLGLAAFGIAACAGEPREAKSADATSTTTTAARTDSNKALVARSIEEIWDRKNPDAVPKFFAENLVNHAAIPEAQGASGMRTIVAKLFAAFPDLTMKVSGMAADGDEVIVRVVAEGTQSGPLEFKNPIPATHKHMRIDQVLTFRLKDGHIVETWMVMDRLDLLGQLGVGPGAAKPPSP
jgi:predicted ester cyclase